MLAWQGSFQVLCRQRREVCCMWVLSHLKENIFKPNIKWVMQNCLCSHKLWINLRPQLEKQVHLLNLQQRTDCLQKSPLRHHDCSLPCVPGWESSFCRCCTCVFSPSEGCFSIAEFFGQSYFVTQRGKRDHLMLWQFWMRHIFPCQ